MRHIAVVLALLCVIASSAQARGVWDNPLHEPRSREFWGIQLPEEYESQVFTNVRKELDGCVINFMQKKRGRRPETLGALTPFILRALRECRREVAALERAHDRIFGKGTGIPYYQAYLATIREFMMDFYKIPVVESK